MIKPPTRPMTRTQLAIYLQRRNKEQNAQPVVITTVLYVNIDGQVLTDSSGKAYRVAT
jgi:hypothetical protein